MKKFKLRPSFYFKHYCFLIYDYIPLYQLCIMMSSTVSFVIKDLIESTICRKEKPLKIIC